MKIFDRRHVIMVVLMLIEVYLLAFPGSPLGKESLWKAAIALALVSTPFLVMVLIPGPGER